MSGTGAASVRVLLLVSGVPEELAEALLADLPRPYAGGLARPLGLDLEAWRDRLRQQVDVGRLLAAVPPPPPGWVALALVGADLFLPVLTYVFGAAETGARRAALSLHRLHAELETDADAAGVLRRRTLVEALHELGHALGLLHCVVPDCPMHRTLWPEALDLKGTAYCLACTQLLRQGLA